MKSRIKIIILEDDLFFGNLIKNFLKNNDYENVELYQEETQCIQAASKGDALLLLDYELIHSTGLDVMAAVQKINPKANFIFLSGQEECHIAIKAIKSGALNYIEKDRNSLVHLKKHIDTFLAIYHGSGVIDPIQVWSSSKGA